MPGIQIGSYNSRELALTENDKESLYMQRLNGKWQVKTYRSETEIDTTLTAPAADVSAWESVTIPEKEGNGAWAAVYRTEFTMPFKWIDREIFVRLDAVSRAYYVYANGIWPVITRIRKRRPISILRLTSRTGKTRWP